jgi:hypothetical protein
VNPDPVPWAEEIRGLGREIATELAGEGSAPEASTEGIGIGWVLWEGITLTGEARMKEGYGGGGWGFWWNYKTTLALRTDGEIVAFETNEGGESPNYGGARAFIPASDDSLLYPDAVRWEDHESIEEAVARTMIDRYRRPVEYAEPRGAGIKQALETVRSQRQPPQRLGQVLVPTPPPQQKSFLRRLFGG